MTTARTALDYPFPPTPGLGLAPDYARLRETEPVARVRLPSGEPAWLVTRYAEVRAVLTDDRFSRAAASTEEAVVRFRGIAPPAGSLLALDPPDHTRLRRLVTGAFTGRRIAALQPRVAEVVDELTADVLAAGPPVDLVATFCSPLPVRVVCELLGVPYADHDRFGALADTVLSSGADAGPRVQQARGQLAGYLAGLVRARREAGADEGEDLLSGMVRAQEGDDRLTDGEIVSLAFAILVAGHATTVNLLASSIQLLLARPELAERLRRNPALVDAAVEELLRWVPLGSVSGFPRVALADVRLGGVTIAAGDAVVPALTAANRDPALVADGDELVLDRGETAHLAFGAGIHRCLGAPLARVELQEGLLGLLLGLPRLRLAVPVEEVPWHIGMLVRGPRELPVTW